MGSSGAKFKGTLTPKVIQILLQDPESECFLTFSVFASHLPYTNPGSAT